MAERRGIAMRAALVRVALVVAYIKFTSAFLQPACIRSSSSTRQQSRSLRMSIETTTESRFEARPDKPTGRGGFLARAVGGVVVTSTVAAAVELALPQPVSAYVKGNTPPAGYNKRKGTGGGGGSGSGAEADEVAGDSLSGQESAPSATFSVTKSGVRYKDLKIGAGPEVKPLDVVDLRYRVEKLGKRSYDGISGETQSVFSLGYGEDDDKEGDVLTVPLGAGRLVSAVDEAVLGMNVGGVRRVAVRPERGWKKQDPKCAAAIDVGALSGVPGAAVAKAEDCIDLALEPRPVGYGATRRMARRFDETLIVEVEMVGAQESSGRVF